MTLAAHELDKVQETLAARQIYVDPHRLLEALAALPFPLREDLGMLLIMRAAG
jgi:hypothetical protein